MKTVRFSTRSKPSMPSDAGPDAASGDQAALTAFASEEAILAGREQKRSLASSSDPPDTADPMASRSTRMLVIIGAVALGVGAIAGGAFWAYGSLPALASSVGSLRVESDPAGAEVRIDGAVRGKTPLTLKLPAGPHQLVLQHGSRTKNVAVTVADRMETVHHIDLPAPVPLAAETPATGSLQVVTEPSRATVLVDGVERGVSPLRLADLAVGEHQVAVRSQGTTHRRTVRIEAGVTASLFIAGAPAGALSGWVSVPSTLPLQIFENGSLVGTSESDRIMLPVGEHQFDFVNEGVGFRTRRSVTVTAGETTKVSMPLPRAPVHINAIPWAEVWIDGERVGETPIGNSMQTLGPHEVVFRHPQLGERKMTLMVTTRDAARISADMRKR